MFQAKAMPSSWRELFTSYLSGCPLYYYAPLKKVLRKYNLHDMVPDVQDSGRSYQVQCAHRSVSLYWATTALAHMLCLSVCRSPTTSTACASSRSSRAKRTTSSTRDQLPPHRKPLATPRQQTRAAAQSSRSMPSHQCRSKSCSHRTRRASGSSLTDRVAQRCSSRFRRSQLCRLTAAVRYQRRLLRLCRCAWRRASALQKRTRSTDSRLTS